MQKVFYTKYLKQFQHQTLLKMLLTIGWLSIILILGYSQIIEELWNTEKKAATESTEIAKEEGLTYLASEREKIMRMSHDEALKELIKMSKIESKIKIIKSISDSGLFGIK